jgi:hypothetical protein
MDEFGISDPRWLQRCKMQACICIGRANGDSSAPRHPHSGLFSLHVLTVTPYATYPVSHGYVVTVK